MILGILLSLFLSIASACKKPEVIFVPVDTNIQRIIEAKDFDSLLVLYWQTLGKATLYKIKLDECEKKR